MNTHSRFSRSLITLGVILLSAIPALAAFGDSLHVITHNKMLVVTDPAKGYNVYTAWGTFPPEKTTYRSVILYVTYRCPDSLRCGEWDYIDNVYLRRHGGAAKASSDIELARMISPYGSRFPHEWHFTWHADISDFAPLLHDSVEIEFRHGGYESNTDRGWLITLDFLLVEGKPPMQLLGMEKLWEGAFPYGDSANSIEHILTPISFMPHPDARVARLRLLQTGHGMDDAENCAEFCAKNRRILFDSVVVDERKIWKKCGTNPLYPQAGTWIYDRANWCPGSIVKPELFDIMIDPVRSHAVEIAMEPYINRNHPTANYVISAYLFYYNLPWVSNDITLEEILAPSTSDEDSRANPICSSPRIRVRNNGRYPIKEFEIRYGMIDGRQEEYEWKGELKPQASEEITLPAPLDFTSGSRQFRVALVKPNEGVDDYPSDNSKTAMVVPPPAYSSPVVVILRTNHDSSHTAYRIVDARGKILHSREAASMRSYTIYRDTLRLDPGCYQLVVSDTAGDGLDFWYNAEGGYGYVRLTDVNGRLLKTWSSDFGSEIVQNFTISDRRIGQEVADLTPVLNVFPIRNPGKFLVDLFLNEKEDVELTITTEDLKAVVYERKVDDFKEGMLDVDISSQPNGYYMVTVRAGDKTASRKMKLKKD